MSQKHLNKTTPTTTISPTTRQYQQASYQPLLTPSDNMNNPALNSDDADGMRAEGGGLPSTYSSQQLMPSSESDSFTENPDNDVRGRHATHDGGRLRNLRSLFMRGLNSSTLIVIILCFVNLINYMDRFTIAGVLEDIQGHFKIGDDSGGLLQTAFVISYMIFAPLFGYLGDRYSRVVIMAVGVFLWSTTTLAGSFAGSFALFITFRALVGIGEASYSTIAPTIISDLFVNNMRSKMLAIFYFAIPVGSGLGYIVGSETAHFAGNWRWALRVTPILGVLAVILIMLIKDPVRGESEGSHSLQATSYVTDLKDLLKNRSFMLSTAGFTCVSFVAGALAWWGPKFIYLGIKMQPGSKDIELKDVSYKFGIIAMAAGLIGVPSGSILAQRLRAKIPNCDPYICAVGLLISAPLVFLSLILPDTSQFWCFLCVFLAQIFLNVCWSIVADILLYVVVPTRRSTAEAFQILISHAFGDAGSPYIVGLISEAIKAKLRPSALYTEEDLKTAPNDDPLTVRFSALQYALFATCFVEVLGGIFFLATAAFIIRDKENASRASQADTPPNRPSSN